MKGTGRVVAMAVARTHVAESVQTRVDWRVIAKRAYYLTTALAAAALIVFIPPQFSYSIPTLVTVFVVAWFLMAVERAEGTSLKFAPLTAVLVASAATVGWWSVVLTSASWAVIRLRMIAEKRPGFIDGALGLVGQIGIGIISVYAMLETFYATQGLAHLVPSVASGVIFVTAILACGVVQQTTNNLLSAVTYWIMGHRVNVRAFSRAGLVASIWAYFLVAVYNFGGIVAIVAFYIVVANSRMMDKALAFVSALEKLENVQVQASTLLQEIGRLAEVSGEEFAADVRYHATRLARHLGLPARQVDQIALAASLHEIGKCKLDPSVRSNHGLMPGQRTLYQRYSYLGGELLRQASVLVPTDVAEIVEQHTEHFDGTGYPYARKGDNIPIGARLLAVARGYVEFLTGHDGSQSLSKEQALAAMTELAGSKYDPGLVDLLSRAVR